MAVFGLPGVGEWIVIGVILLLAFGPTAIVAWFAYRLGVSRGLERAEERPSPRAEEQAEAQVATAASGDEDSDV